MTTRTLRTAAPTRPMTTRDAEVGGTGPADDDQDAEDGGGTDPADDDQDAEDGGTDPADEDNAASARRHR